LSRHYATLQCEKFLIVGRCFLLLLAHCHSESVAAL
jgi:hypothetical protein